MKINPRLIMKLSWLPLLTLSLAAPAQQETPRTENQTPASSQQLAYQYLPLLPLPEFHESWNDEEKAILLQLAQTIHDDFSQQQDTDVEELLADDVAPIWNKFQIAYHRAVKEGVIEDSFGESDTFARWAAMHDQFEAVKFFIEKGESISACYEYTILSMSAPSPSCLAQEVIWGKSLTESAHSAEERVEMLQWLQSKGWDPLVNASSVTYAITVLCMADPMNVSALLDWYFSTGIQPDEENEKANLYRAILQAHGGTASVQKLVEQGEILLNGTIDDLLPLQIACQPCLLQDVFRIDTLKYLLEAGADPNLIVAYDYAQETDYSEEAFEDEDVPNADLDGFSTPIEIIFDNYRYNTIEGKHHNDKAYLAAIDLLLLHGAELEIEEDEANDEDVESPAYAEVRKRLQMTDDELQADYECLTR